VNYSTHPPEGKITAAVAVMRGKSKDGYHRHHSNKHYNYKERIIVWVKLGSESDGGLIFASKD
jgi:hypothetical protein